MVIYAAVTKDEFELPIAVADSEKELAFILGISKKAVTEGVRKYLAGKRSDYIKIRVDK